MTMSQKDNAVYRTSTELKCYLTEVNATVSLLRRTQQPTIALQNVSAEARARAPRRDAPARGVWFRLRGDGPHQSAFAITLDVYDELSLKFLQQEKKDRK